MITLLPKGLAEVEERSKEKNLETYERVFV
jgi:hypothetical protein